MEKKQKQIDEMNVGIISYEYPPLIYGGVGIHVDELTRHLANNISQVHVFTSHVEGLDDQDSGNVHVHRSSKPLVPASNRSSNLFGRMPSDFNVSGTLRGYISNDKLDMVHSNRGLSLTAATAVKKATNIMPAMVAQGAGISRPDLDVSGNVVKQGFGDEVDSSIALSGPIIQRELNQSFLVDGLYGRESGSGYLHGASELLVPTSNYSKKDFKRIITNINVAKMVEKYICNDKLDLLHSHGGLIQMAATEAKKNTHLPLVMTAHSLEINRVRPDKLSVLMEQNVVNKVDRFIAVSVSMRKELNQAFGIKNNMITVIPNGVDTAVFKRENADDIRSKYHLENRFVVLFVGRDDPQKGAKRLVDAVKDLAGQIPDIMLILVGHKDIYFDKHVLCLPNVSKSELVKLYSLSDVFVLPSIYEPFGIVLIEAMACETACIGMRVGGIPDIIDHGRTGLLVESDDSTGLFEAISDLYHDPDKRYRMGKNGRDRVISCFDWESISRKTIGVYRQACS